MTTEVKHLLFNCGRDLATVAVGSDLLTQAHAAISELAGKCSRESNTDVSVKHKVVQHANYTIIAFATSTTAEAFLQQGTELVSASEGFKFLSSENVKEFSIIKAAKSLFESSHQDILGLINELLPENKDKGSPRFLKKDCVITGQGLGGSIASLFTLCLLDQVSTLDPKRPLCITFGSPLIGDVKFKEAILQYPIWISCFLHVIHKDDPFPGIVDLTGCSPFGTFLFCADSGCACFENPEAISQVLLKFSESRNGRQEPLEYGCVIKSLQTKLLYADSNELSKTQQGRAVDLYEMGINVQLALLGLVRAERNWGQKEMLDHEKTDLKEKWEVDSMESAKKLNDLKMKMAQLEWYKKKKGKAGGSGYYDSYKDRNNNTNTDNMDVDRFKIPLNNYWKDVVSESEKKPQIQGANLRVRWLLAGNLYRRMIEPLDIANYYDKNGTGNYPKDGRSEIYKKLEKWQEEEAERKEKERQEKKGSTEPVSQKDRIAQKKMDMIRSNLTVDSCFWAHVEEALRSCELLKRNSEHSESQQSLKEFESCVVDKIENYELSPEVFLPGSTYMKWYKTYDEEILQNNILGVSYCSKLKEFMESDTEFHEYKELCAQSA